jgi:transposase
MGGCRRAACGDRYLDLAPKYWAATRARISERELNIEVGDITVLPPLTPPEQTASR